MQTVTPVTVSSATIAAVNLVRDSLRVQLMAAGGIAILFEVSLRKLCESHPTGSRLAYGDLERKVLVGVLDVFQAHLSDEEVHLLKWSIQLRNKIAHGQFQMLDTILERDFGIESRDVLRSISVPDEPGRVLHTLDALIAGDGTDNVREQHQKEQAGTHLWEFQAAVSGTLNSAAEILGRAVDLMDRLATIEDL